MWCATCSAQRTMLTCNMQRATHDADLQHAARTGATQHALLACKMQRSRVIDDRRTRVLTHVRLPFRYVAFHNVHDACTADRFSLGLQARLSRPAHATLFSASCERAATRRLCRSVPNSSIQSQTERARNATRSCSNRLYAHPNVHSRTYPCGQRWRVGSPARAGAVRHRAAVRHDRARHMEGSGPHTRTGTCTCTYTHAHTHTHTHTHTSARISAPVHIRHVHPTHTRAPCALI
jgi:hypothetical protein